MSEINNKTKFIFVTGGVVSSLGKGITTASLGALLQARGYKIGIRKLDPYLNIDPGTMSPYQHGEVFVTNDGTEADLDLGHYERFTGIETTCNDSITSGKIYSTLLQRERNGYYLGGTVQVIPHVTDLIMDFITKDTNHLDFMLCEIGGTVGDIEALPYFETIRQIGYKLSANMKSSKVIYIHLTLVPYLESTKELKTKPTQHSVKELRSIGIQPNIIVCRADRQIPQNELKKIGLFCNVAEEYVISAIDCNNIYSMPLIYHAQGLDTRVLDCFNIDVQKIKEPNLEPWKKIVYNSTHYEKEINIGIIGKYNELKDAYKSLIQAIEHSGIYHRCKINIKWIDSAIIENNKENDDGALNEIFKDTSGVIVPGGFGNRGIEGMITAIKYARENNIPFLGICLGMQLAIIEYARNVLKIKGAHSTEFDKDCENPVISLIEKNVKNEHVIYKYHDSNVIGGTMRLGAYKCKLKVGSFAYEIYNNKINYNNIIDTNNADINNGNNHDANNEKIISERHRHRWEFNNKYKEIFENNIENNIVISGISCNDNLVEIIELQKNKHKFFIATQFHPEFKSRPFKAHPLFISFINACLV